MLSALLLTHVLAVGAPAVQDPMEQYMKNMVPVGKMAPNFVVNDAAGKKFELHKSFKKSKGTIVNFWFAQ